MFFFLDKNLELVVYNSISQKKVKILLLVQPWNNILPGLELKYLNLYTLSIVIQKFYGGTFGLVLTLNPFR